MERIGVFYATREGHTASIAERIACYFRGLGMHVDLRNLRESEPPIDLGKYSAAILAASVHAGKHEREMVHFVREHVDELNHLPSAFISVTLSQAGVEMAGAPAVRRELAAADVQSVLLRFYADTGWHPKHVKPVAGALLYRQYNFLLRWIMKRISKKAGGSTDTSRNHVYTDWAGLDRFVESLGFHRLGQQGQRERETAALAHLALERDRAAVLLHQLPGDRQT